MTRHILISLLVNAGDVIMMTSALDLMRRELPSDTRLGVLLRPESFEILDGNPLVDEIIVYPYRSGSPFFGLRQVRRQIKAGKYDYFLALDRRPRGAMAALLSGIKKRVGPSLLFAGNRPEWWTRFLFSRTVRIQPAECAGSQVSVFQTVVKRAFNIKGRGRISLPPLTSEKRSWASEVLPHAQGPTIGLCVRTNAEVKTWPAAGFAGLIDKLYRGLSAGIYITGGPEDVEYIDHLLKMTHAVPVVNLAGKTRLMDIQALAFASDLFIGLDNATAHLAANSGLDKIICLLLATKPEIIVDSMPKAKFISLTKLENRTPLTEGELIKNEIEIVYQAVAEMLSKRND